MPEPTMALRRSTRLATEPDGLSKPTPASSTNSKPNLSTQEPTKVTDTTTKRRRIQPRPISPKKQSKVIVRKKRKTKPKPVDSKTKTQKAQPDKQVTKKKVVKADKENKKEVAEKKPESEKKKPKKKYRKGVRCAICGAYPGDLTSDDDAEDSDSTEEEASEDEVDDELEDSSEGDELEDSESNDEFDDSDDSDEEESAKEIISSPEKMSVDEEDVERVVQSESCGGCLMDVDSISRFVYQQLANDAKLSSSEEDEEEEESSDEDYE